MPIELPPPTAVLQRAQRAAGNEAKAADLLDFQLAGVVEHLQECALRKRLDVAANLLDLQPAIQSRHQVPSEQVEAEGKDRHTDNEESAGTEDAHELGQSIRAALQVFQHLLADHDVIRIGRKLRQALFEVDLAELPVLALVDPLHAAREEISPVIADMLAARMRLDVAHRDSLVTADVEQVERLLVAAEAFGGQAAYVFPQCVVAGLAQAIGGMAGFDAEGTGLRGALNRHSLPPSPTLPVMGVVSTLDSDRIERKRQSRPLAVLLTHQAAVALQRLTFRRAEAPFAIAADLGQDAVGFRLQLAINAVVVLFAFKDLELGPRLDQLAERGASPGEPRKIEHSSQLPVEVVI